MNNVSSTTTTTATATKQSKEKQREAKGREEKQGEAKRNYSNIIQSYRLLILILYRRKAEIYILFIVYLHGFISNRIFPKDLRPVFSCPVLIILLFELYSITTSTLVVISRCCKCASLVLLLL